MKITLLAASYSNRTSCTKKESKMKLKLMKSWNLIQTMLKSIEIALIKWNTRMKLVTRAAGSLQHATIPASKTQKTNSSHQYCSLCTSVNRFHPYLQLLQSNKLWFASTKKHLSTIVSTNGLSCKITANNHPILLCNGPLCNSWNHRSHISGKTYNQHIQIYMATVPFSLRKIQLFYLYLHIQRSCE